MKTLMVCAVLSLLWPLILSAKNITVNVVNIDNNKAGNIIIMLFASEGFPQKHNKAIKKYVQQASIAKMTFSFTQVPEEFAIKVLHDEDESGEVNKNWTGFMPSEGLGFSNGAKLNFGPPRFDDAKLSLADVSSSLSITMIYP